MAIPSGSGSEVLKSSFQTSNSTASFLLTVTANHIYTVISIICHNISANTVSPTLTIDPDGGTHGEMHLYQPTLKTKETFVVNDRFVLNSGDKFYLGNSSGNDCHVLVTYIDQDWS